MTVFKSIKQYALYYLGAVFVISLCIHQQALKEFLMRLTGLAISVAYISNMCQLILGDTGRAQLHEIEHWATTGLFTVIAVIVTFTLGINGILHFLE